jgi:hypothetical protein
MAEAVRHAVSELAPGQRDAVLAFYWQGLTHAEAALELGGARARRIPPTGQGPPAPGPQLAQHETRPFDPNRGEIPYDHDRHPRTELRRRRGYRG